MRDRHPRSRIEDVAIAASVDLEIALVIAAGCDGAVDDVEAGDGPIRRARIANADAPG